MKRPFEIVVLGLALTALSPLRAEEAGSIAGVTEPIRSVVLKAWGKKTPPWSGRIAKVHVKEGDKVTAGQVLLEMDKHEEEIDVRLKKLLAHSDQELTTVKKREELQKKLWQLNKGVADENKSVSGEDVTKRELEYRITQGERARLEVGDQRAAIELESAELELANRSLKSPIDGIVVKVHLHEGESCETNDPLVQIVDTSRCNFVCNIEEKVGRNLTAGQQVTLRLQAGAGQETRTATISYVSPVVEPASFLMQVKAEFSNPDGRIRPGVPGVMIPGTAGQ